MLALERHVCYFLEYGSAFMTSQVSLAFIGFGEAGLAIAETLSASGLATGMRAHDIKLTTMIPRSPPPCSLGSRGQA